MRQRKLYRNYINKCLLVAHGSEDRLKLFRVISFAENILHGIDGRLDATAVATIRDDLDLELGSIVSGLEIVDGEQQRGEYLIQAKLVRVVDWQQE